MESWQRDPLPCMIWHQRGEKMRNRAKKRSRKAPPEARAVAVVERGVPEIERRSTRRAYLWAQQARLRPHMFLATVGLGLLAAGLRAYTKRHEDSPWSVFFSMWLGVITGAAPIFAISSILEMYFSSRAPRVDASSAPNNPNSPWPQTPPARAGGASNLLAPPSGTSGTHPRMELALDELPRGPRLAAVRSLFQRHTHTKTRESEAGEPGPSGEAASVVDRGTQPAADASPSPRLDPRRSDIGIEDDSSLGVSNADCYAGLQEHIRLARTRIQREIDVIQRRGSSNLALGCLITLAAISLLVFTAFVPAPPTATNISSYDYLMNLPHMLIPRISIVLFVEFFSFFFLRLYRSSVQETKYFQNELTNLDAKAIAVEVALLSGDKEAMKGLATELARTERNFVLKKDETTVELEVVKAEVRGLREVVSSVNGLLRPERQKTS
ncbi:hypothetical protein LZ198_38035 [Myxococcus sp. K15C18031901]|uniref:hypothetical protein n=1 Tax=Myxococcus dinghuensis TaxID=2906761 RepID=UPI0020A81046|nr:hypothetical protein [Myxococcus dinghuensis]MCP3104681.1 hypothetical protein [Myxococcus dinghuensis]